MNRYFNRGNLEVEGENRMEAKVDLIDCRMRNALRTEYQWNGKDRIVHISTVNTMHRIYTETIVKR